MAHNYAKAFRIVRTSRGLSQKELAERTNLDASYISLLESGQRTPSHATIAAISSALSIPSYMITFLATGAENLKGISEEHAAAIGRALLRILMEDFPHEPE